MKQTRTPTLAAIAIALTAFFAASAWVVLDVQVNFSGHLNGLFYTGLKAPLPPDLAGDHTWRVDDARGYDGAFYHLIAHDPLNRRGFLAYVDSPRYRWRRIGLPALAYLIAGGNDAWVDRVFVALQLGFVFLGAFWLSRYAQELGRHPAWGIAFLVIPAVAISLDRMTVDLPLAALTIGLLYYAALPNSHWRLYGVLIAAPAIRETGLILILAWCVWRITDSQESRRIREASLGVACAIPVLSWYLYAALHTQSDNTSFIAAYPFGGLVTWTHYALAHPRAAYGQRASAVLELLALAGIWLAFILSIAIGVRRRTKLPEILAVTFAAFACVIGYQDIWATAYGIGRTLSPLLIALAAIGLRDSNAVFAVPLLAIAPRIGLQFAAEIWVALH